MKKQIMLGGLLLLLGSCTPQNKANDPNAIDIAVSLEHLTELKTSQLGKQIRYIPLETTDSSLIGNSYSIKLSKDHIFVSTNGRCLSFNKQTGKYLGSIGHKGEDPQGYSNANCFIHPHTNNLYFYRQPDKLVKYDTKGNYLGQVHLPQKISPSLYFTFSDSLILAHYGEGIGQPQASALLYFNEQGEVKDSLPEFANPGDPMGMDQDIQHQRIQAITRQRQHRRVNIYKLSGWNNDCSSYRPAFTLAEQRQHTFQKSVQ